MQSELKLFEFLGHEHVVKLLIEKNADVNAQNDFGKTALEWAAVKGNDCRLW